MKKYEEPNLEILLFAQDVLTQSNEGFNGNGFVDNDGDLTKDFGSIWG